MVLNARSVAEYEVVPGHESKIMVLTLVLLL